MTKIVVDGAMQVLAIGMQLVVNALIRIVVREIH